MVCLDIWTSPQLVSYFLDPSPFLLPEEHMSVTIANSLICFHNRMSQREIRENIKLAREYALLGNYSSASVLYRGLLDQIGRTKHAVRDGSVQQEWQQVTTTACLIFLG